ncbi:uncharacterized protein J3D65DRAFT_106842 [Phyllosticta citribraziliensis]|uniref:Uncharacterized protein n=1 Tax=Phyllosticta citribraziliensis TaxID=989973 RepID=A0ABR1LB41_9PEZI
MRGATGADGRTGLTHKGVAGREAGADSEDDEAAEAEAAAAAGEMAPVVVVVVAAADATVWSLALRPRNADKNFLTTPLRAGGGATTGNAVRSMVETSAALLSGLGARLEPSPGAARVASVSAPTIGLAVKAMVEWPPRWTKSVGALMTRGFWAPEPLFFLLKRPMALVVVTAFGGRSSRGRVGGCEGARRAAEDEAELEVMNSEYEPAIRSVEENLQRQGGVVRSWRARKQRRVSKVACGGLVLRKSLNCYFYIPDPQHPRPKKVTSSTCTSSGRLHAHLSSNIQVQ